jgi:NAD+ kinase
VTSPGTAAPAPAAARDRRVLVIAHTGRADAREVAREFCRGLTKNDITLRLLQDEAVQLELDLPEVDVVAPSADAAAECEVVVVIGGDGTILRAAEMARECGTPLLGINLGHVGFLAEAESDDVESTIDAIVHRRYTAEERLTLDVSVYRDVPHPPDGLPAGADTASDEHGDVGVGSVEALTDGGKELVCSTWALNEASVEKASRERMLEVVVEVDGRPLSRWGCDGVVCATPTGSTAYNFSAGGPIVWPGVEALLMVPISAHALFARPLVVAPTSVLAVEVIGRTDGAGVLWCDGRRTVDLPPGARIEVRRGQHPVRLVRLHTAPFTDRLVAKFDLPVSGWRGAAERRRREEHRA